MTTNPCAIPLARYAQIIGMDECAFFGIAYDGQEHYACRTFWTEWQRNAVARALASAQQMLEDFIRWPLCPTWITGQLTENTDGRLVDEQPFGRNPLVTRWAYVLAGGIRAESVIEDGATVDYTDPDIATVGPIATTIAGTHEVRIFYPGSDREITPSKMTYTGGNLTIEIPRCRLLREDLLYQTGDSNPFAKTDTTNFVATVDVRRVYNDPSTQAEFVKAHVCGAGCLNGCAVETDGGCIVVKDGVVGIVRAEPAAHSDGQWQRARLCGCYDSVRLNYMAGKRTLTPATEDVIVRLAHTLMPDEPCGCDVIKRLWERDRFTPEILTRERLNAPFGQSDGAWFAYQWAKANTVIRGAVI